MPPDQRLGKTRFHVCNDSVHESYHHLAFTNRPHMIQTRVFSTSCPHSSQREPILQSSFPGMFPLFLVFVSVCLSTPLLLVFPKEL